MGLKQKYNPLEVIKKFNNFKKDLNKIKQENSLLNDLKLIWYTRYRFPKLRKLLARSCIENATFALTNPDCFINIITAYVSTLISITHDDESLKRLLSAVFDGKPPITLFFKLTPKNTIEKYILSYKGVIPKESSYDPDRLVTLVLDVNIEKIQCSLERTVYNTNNPEQIVDVRVIDHKTLNISPNGNLYNENYIFDEKIKEEDYKLYTHCISLLLTPFVVVLDFITHPITIFNPYIFKKMLIDAIDQKRKQVSQTEQLPTG